MKTSMDWRILLLLFCAGCFPYRETYRPAIDGVVVDGAGKAAANLRVESCSATHWNSKCRYHASTTTDGEGRFHFTQIKEWDWCCLGEAPMPYTVFAACAADGSLASGRVYGPTAESYQLTLAARSDDEWAKHACAK